MTLLPQSASKRSGYISKKGGELARLRALWPWIRLALASMRQTGLTVLSKSTFALASTIAISTNSTGGVKPVVSESSTQNPPDSRRFLAHTPGPHHRAGAVPLEVSEIVSPHTPCIVRRVEIPVVEAK